MTSTVFVPNITPVPSIWLNDINNHVYTNTPISPAITVHPSSVLQYTPAGTGAVATTVQSKLRESVSVKDFGAIGNGVTNDTAAIQAAHDAAVASNFNEITVPPGIYLLNSGLTISQFVTFRTTGAVLFNYSAASGTAFTISGAYGRPQIVIDTGNALDSYGYLFQGNFIIQATHATNTALCFYLGATGVYTGPTRFLEICGVSTSNFAANVEFGSHAYLIRFSNCSFLGNYNQPRKASCNGIKQTAAAISDSGENIVFDHCTFQHQNSAVLNNNTVGSNALFIKFNDCSFDQCSQVVGDDISLDMYEFNGCHFEWDGLTTAIYASGDTVKICGGMMHTPNAAYASPLFGNANTGGNIEIDESFMHLMGAVAPVFVVSDATSRLKVPDAPLYYSTSLKPTVYDSPTTLTKRFRSLSGNTVTYITNANAAAAWTSDSNPQPAIGNGTITGEYYRTGSLFNVRIKLLIGSTTTLGTGVWRFTLPVPIDGSGLSALGTVFINDNGTGELFGICRAVGPGGTLLRCYTTGTGAVIMTNTAPIAWAAGDYVEMNISFVTLVDAQF